MTSAVVTTGSTVEGLVPGLRDHLGGVAVMYTNGNPSGIVTPAQYGVGALEGVSGAVIAYSSTTDKYYKHVSGDNGNVWNELGSVDFT